MILRWTASRAWTANDCRPIQHYAACTGAPVTDNDFATISAATCPLFHPFITPGCADPVTMIGPPERVYKRDISRTLFIVIDCKISLSQFVYMRLGISHILSYD